MSILHKTANATSDKGKNGVILSIPIGENGIYYAGEYNPDMFKWELVCIAVAPHGSFWIADTADNHLLHFDTKGIILNKIAIKDIIVGADDLVILSGNKRVIRIIVGWV
jgi:hypothetical protein